MREGEIVEIECPECTRRIRKTVDWFMSHDKMSCIECGAVMIFKTNRCTLCAIEITNSMLLPKEKKCYGLTND
jgi:hypothetical protein